MSSTSSSVWSRRVRSPRIASGRTPTSARSHTWASRTNGLQLPVGRRSPHGHISKGEGAVAEAVKIRVFALCLASIIVALATYVGSAPSSVGSEARVPMSLSAEAIQTAASAAELARLIGVFEARVKEHTDALDYLFLGKLYLQRARSTVDLGSYTQAGAALERSLALYPCDPDALAARPRLRYPPHDFAGAARNEEGEALAVAPDYYVAEAGFARAGAALGRIDDAIAHYERAIAIVPQPEYLAALGDLYTLRGDTTRAARAYDTVEVSASLATLGQRLYDRQFALFYLEHERSLD